MQSGGHHLQGDARKIIDQFKADERELKKRISLSVLPSLYDDIQKIAYVQRRSVSELLSTMMEEYRGSHATELTEYEKVKK